MAVARQSAETFLDEAERETRLTEAGVARRLLGVTCLCTGDSTEAKAHLEEALRIYDPERDRNAKFRFGIDTDLGATAYLAPINWMLGDVGRARELVGEALAYAVKSAHSLNLANAYLFKAIIETLRGDAEATLQAAESLVQFSREHGVALYSALGSRFSAWARARLGECETSVTELRQALVETANQGLWVPFFQGLLAEIEAEAEGAEGALALIDEALALSGQTGQRWSDAFLHRIRGEILLKLDPANTAPAEEAFVTAIAIAQQQKARTFELRAAMSMARLWRDQGKAQQARELLAPVYGWFTEGFDTLDLKEAKALLDELRA